MLRPQPRLQIRLNSPSVGLGRCQHKYRKVRNRSHRDNLYSLLRFVDASISGVKTANYRFCFERVMKTTRNLVLIKLNKRHGNETIIARNLGHRAILNENSVESHGLGYQPEDLAMKPLKD